MNAKRWMDGLDRRGFFWAGWASIAATGLGFLLSTFRFLVPNVLYEPPRASPSAARRSFRPGAVTFLAERRLFVFNTADGFYAISAVCTHLGLQREARGEGLRLPVPRQPFEEDGRVVRGPAPGPLPRFALSLSPRGELVVDLDRAVSPDFRLRACRSGAPREHEPATIWRVGSTGVRRRSSASAGRAPTGSRGGDDVEPRPARPPDPRPPPRAAPPLHARARPHLLLPASSSSP